MFGIFDLISGQIGSSFKWFFLSFLLTIVALIILRRKKLLKSNGFIGSLKMALYYIAFPIIIGIASLIYVATKHVEEDINKVAITTIDSIENAIYPSFNKYITSIVNEYIDIEKIPTNDEIVSGFLKEDSESGWMKKKVLHWTLVETLEYIEEKALEKTGDIINVESLNISAISKAGDKAVLDVPFKYLKGKSKKTIKGLLSTYYLVSYILFGIVLLILVLDIYFSIRKNKKELELVELTDSDQTFIDQKDQNLLD